MLTMLRILTIALLATRTIADSDDTCDPACGEGMLGGYGGQYGRPRNIFNRNILPWLNSLSSYYPFQQQALYGAYQLQPYGGPMNYYTSGVYCRKGQYTKDLIYGDRACFCWKYGQRDDEEADDYDEDCLPDPNEFRFVRRCNSKRKSQDLPGRLVSSRFTCFYLDRATPHYYF